MTKKCLPIGKPPITGYMHHLYPLSILARDTAYRPWFYCHYIQLRQFEGRGLNFYLHPFYREFSTCPLLESNRVDRRLAGDKPDEVTKFVLECLERDYYVQLDVDYFYIPQGVYYQRVHFLHELLLSGFDWRQGTFTASGYGRDGSYGRFAVGFAEFERALSTAFRPEGGPDWLQDKVENPQVVLYYYRSSAECAFDLVQAREELTDLYLSRNTSTRLRILAEPRNRGDLWGMDTYQFLAGLLDEPEATEDELLISLRIFWEHKKCMVARLEYMEGQGILPEEVGFARRYSDIASRANQIRMVVLRNQMRGKKAKEGRTFAQDELCRLRKDEFALLGEVLSHLSSLR